MDTTDLPAATLDCWVERAELLRLNPQASTAEVAGISQWPKYTLNPELTRPIIEREQIFVEQVDDPYRGILFVAHRPDVPRQSLYDSALSFGNTYLDAAMFCYVAAVFGEGAEHKMLWDDGTPRYEPPYD